VTKQRSLTVYSHTTPTNGGASFLFDRDVGRSGHEGRPGGSLRQRDESARPPNRRGRSRTAEPREIGGGARTGLVTAPTTAPTTHLHPPAGPRHAELVDIVHAGWAPVYCPPHEDIPGSVEAPAKRPRLPVEHHRLATSGRSAPSNGPAPAVHGDSTPASDRGGGGGGDKHCRPTPTS